eukprot:gene17415-22965_t
MSTILEAIRQRQETIESYEVKIGDVLETKPLGQKGKILQQHQVNELVNAIVQATNEIKQLYEDKDNLFKDEISTMRGNKMFGWKQVDKQKNNDDPQPLRLEMFNSANELEALGIDRLKEALEAIGLKCGGTLKDRAERLWSVKGLKPEDIPEKLKAKANNNKKRKLDEVEGTNELIDKRKQIAWEEYRITSISEIMMDIIISTKRHTEKIQTLTIEEKELELYEEENIQLVENNNKESKKEDDDDDEPIYNPLNLPLGWDGKPIPYWLYKLHGLGVEFKCEICGNYSYWGRRNFDRHFSEWRHNYGMKCLGIPNSKHFHDITLIEDAVTLYNKIKDQIDSEQFLPDLQEEFEDTEGNVLNRRTFEDLARQGLL